MNCTPIRGHSTCRKQRTRRLIHEGHEFVRETGHGAADADPAHVGATAHSSHPTALPHIALDHRSPAAQLHDALNRSIFLCKLGLLVVSASVTSFVHRLTEQPCGTQSI